jgi:hypothetical protein
MRYGLRRWRSCVSGVWELVRGAAYLFPHFPQALHTMEQVAAPQQLAAKERTWERVS